MGRRGSQSFAGCVARLTPQGAVAVVRVESDAGPLSRSPVPSAPCVAFAGAPRTGNDALSIGARWLAGQPAEEIFAGAVPTGARDEVSVFRPAAGRRPGASRSFRGTGAGRRPFTAVSSPPPVARTSAASGITCRKSTHTGGLEHYRAFCSGRSLAFEDEFGPGFQARLPAASAVGTAGDWLEVIFAASEEQPRHFESPVQVPAYRYPPEHTAAVAEFRPRHGRARGRGAGLHLRHRGDQGHETVAAGQLGPQLDCTLRESPPDRPRRRAGQCARRRARRAPALQGLPAPRD